MPALPLSALSFLLLATPAQTSSPASSSPASTTPTSATSATPSYIPGPSVKWKISAGGNGHIYQAVAAPAGVTWDEANAYATLHGCYLASIESAAENEFVYKLLDGPQYWLQGAQQAGPWLGGVKSSSSTRPDEGWSWPHSRQPFAYTNWYPG